MPLERVHLDDANAMDGMSKLMHQYILCMVFVNLIGQHILFSATGERLFQSATQPTCPQVPVQCRIIYQISVLGDVGSTFVAPHNGNTGISIFHGLQYFRGKHAGHGIKCAVRSCESGVRHTPRRDERQAIHVNILGIELVQMERIGRRCHDTFRNLQFFFHHFRCRFFLTCGKDEEDKNSRITDRFHHLF